ncbi:predicted protein [Naegleria gruberi]|uniref:Predicted protein n=1 Tax=Naegleria gruberi TaxID=5762 RepID=D2VT50_NAEGR|nr:uncharacterized protein NAEGRDRAFT_72174 [Naegleria gruberi]EFC40085.1 predicted protein [Naegleria gruberi]|eukprot:XP_002672829.1 predicted protein [Naegleria gruberi strain NEG-M]
MQRTYSYSGNVYSAPPSNINMATSSSTMSSSPSPVQSSSTTTPTRTSPISSSSPTQKVSQEKVKLFETRKDREKFENMSELYSLIYSVERLEKAYVKDSIKADEYTKACSKLIAKFKTITPIVSADVPDIEKFMREYKLDCPAATNRLLKVGVPATVEHGGKDTSGESTAKQIAQTTQYFITLMDSIKLGLVAKDQLAPMLLDLMDSLNKLQIKEFEGKLRIKDWIVTFNQMKAHENLDDDQARQLYYDVEQAYNQFHKVLQ